MSKKIIGATVGTPTSPKKIEDEIKPVKTVNGKEPDENGNIEVEKPTYTAKDVGALPAEALPEAINDALAQAKESGEFDGADGKTAYAYAKDGGYTGTEAEFAARIAFLMGYSVYGYIDADNNIILSGDISQDDTYFTKFITNDGSTVDIGELDFTTLQPEPEEPDTPTYTNLLPLSVDENGNDYVGTDELGGDGYEYGYRISASDGSMKATNGAYCSGFIPLSSNNGTVRFKNITMFASSSGNNLCFYAANKTRIAGFAGVTNGFPEGVTESNGVYSFAVSTFCTSANLGFFRFSCGGITDETIVTVDEEIV